MRQFFFYIGIIELGNWGICGMGDLGTVGLEGWWISNTGGWGGGLLGIFFYYLFILG